MKGAGPFSGTYYHAKEISPADIRKAARDKTSPQGALDALAVKWKGESPVTKTEPGTTGSKEPQEGEGITSAPGAQPVSSPSSQEDAGPAGKGSPAATQEKPLEQSGDGEREVEEKEPWEMTRDEYAKSQRGKSLKTWADHFRAMKPGDTLGRAREKAERNNESGRNERRDQAHKNLIRHAFEDGRPISASVLADYPDLLREYLTSGASKGFSDGLKKADVSMASPHELQHTWFHGSIGPAFNSFDEGQRGKSTEARSAKLATFMARREDTAKSYADMSDAGDRYAPTDEDRKEFERTYRARTSAKNVVSIDMHGKDYAELLGDDGLSELLENARSLKFDGVLLKNVWDANDADVKPDDVLAIFDNGKLKIEREQPEVSQKPAEKKELPADISKSKPRYGYRDKNFEVDFEDPTDLAAYTLTQKTPNKAHDRFLQYYRDQFGTTAGLEPHARRVKEALKKLAKDADPADGPLKLLSQAGTMPEPVTLSPDASTGLTVLVEDHAAEDPTATLDDVLRDKDTGNFIAQALVNDGIITNSADNVNPTTGLLTTSAKTKVGDALLGELLPPEVIEQTPDFLKQKLLGVMGSIKGIRSAGDGWNLQEQIVAATERYDQIFRGQDTYEQGPVVEAILKKMDEPIDKVRTAFSSFAVAATNHDPSDKPFFDFNLAFGTELTQDQYEKGLKPVEKSVSQPLTEETKPDNNEVTAKPLAKGDKVTYRTNKGKERTGEVAWTDGKKVRITDNGSTVNKSIEDVKPIAGPAAVEQVSPGGQPEQGPEPSADATLVDALQLKFEHGAGPKNYNDLKKIVTEFDGSEPDQLRMKEAQEAYEAMLNRVASEIVNKNSGGAHEVFDRMVRLYEGQPNLSIRTSTSIAGQAYSTPLPLAFIADKFAGITWNTTTVYEPTAGNGALLIAANPKMVQANELNPARAETLEAEGFHVTRNDATVFVPFGRVDAVVANPPFGPLAGPVKVDGYNVVKLDHLIVAKALGAMKDAGKAAIIIAAGDREKPGEITNQVRPFFNWLYAHYNVVSDFEVEGDLYSRQGASYPVRMIAIDGRVRSAKVSPDSAAIPRLKTWGEVYDKAAEHLGTNLAGQRPANDVAGGPVRIESANAGAVSGTAAGPNRPSDSGQPETSEAGTGSNGGTKPQPGPIAHSGRPVAPAVGSADSTVRPDGDVARSDRLAEGQPAPRTVRRGTAEPDGHSANALADESNQFQTSYRPHSSKKDVAVMAPKALIEPMQAAMDRIGEEVGDVDQWVTDQLGYPDVETMHEAFMGIQTDAVAAAIYQMQRSKAFICGWQTGLGKGRVAAAMIRWAELHGHTPVFVTESAPLFSPMYADLQDIGSGQTIAPLLFNADASITNPKTGTKIFQNPGAMRPVLDRIRETGELPKGRNAVFLTYSQINTDNRQQLTLQRIAPNAIFILDESHNAGGDSNTGNFLSELVSASKGVLFLSATWAKRPDNLPLYAGMTDISIAIPDRALVAAAITAGGAPLQAVLTSLVADTGQFSRLEKSFDGIDMPIVADEKNEAEHKRISDKVTELLRGIVTADALFHNLDFERIQAQAKKAGKSAGSKGVVVQHMEFSSIVHNLVKQLLLALKADTAANEIIASIERGEKPVFALENTMGAFLDSYINGHNLSEGDSLAGLDYSRISDRALMRTRYYNETDQMGNKTRIEVPLDDLSAPVRAAYDETQRLIDALQVDLPVSPIDYIRNKVEKAGYKIAEITGRNWRIDYSGDVPRLGTVPGVERKDRVNTATQFNNGGLDALIINRAGSTGISLHAGEKFRDQRPRHMIVGQPAGDVNIVMQILGRINRTGQMVLPRYTFLVCALPAEQRPAINLAKKMKSLNANVSSNTRAATSIQAVDLMNKYGDRIVAQYLFDNPQMSRLLGLSADTNEKGEPSGNEGLAMKATGHSALLPVSQQQEFMDSISEAYTNYIDFLDETGQNDLEPQTYDYAARELHTERMYQGVDPSSPFGQDANYGEYSIKRQGKPFTPEEVMERIAETFGPAAMQLAPRERDTLAARDLAAHFEELYKPYLAGLVHEGTVERAQQMRTRGRQLLSDYRVSTGVRIELNGEQYNGIITNIEGAKKPSGNPYAPSSLQFTIAVNSGLRQTKVPGSQMDSLVTSNLGRNADVRQLFKDYGSDRQKAKIITGNLLGAYGELKTGAKGRIISFTMEDGTSKLGILMPSKFDIKTEVSETYAMRSPVAALKLLESDKEKLNILQSGDKTITIFGYPDDREMEIRTVRSKAYGGKFFLDARLLELVVGGDFVSSGGVMKATVKEGRELDALKAIMGKTTLYVHLDRREEARELDEKAKAELDKPKVPKRASGSVTMSFLGMGALDPLATKLLQPVVDYAKKAAVATWDEIVKIAGKTSSSPRQIGYDIASVLYPPVLASPTARDIMGKALGTPAFEIFKASQLLNATDKMFQKMSEKEWVEFVDRIQNPSVHRLPHFEEANAQVLLQAILERQREREQWVINLGRDPKKEPIVLQDKEGYFPNRYSKPPGDHPILSEDEEMARIFPKRPFEGPQTFRKQQRYTLKDAVADGAVPLGNPVRMVMRRLQEGAKFVAANEALWNGRQARLVIFKKPHEKMPPGFVKINDKIAQVWRPIETTEGDKAFIQGGEWVIEKDFGRLLNNFLSLDHIREFSVGRGLVNLKNASLACKLGFSLYHYGVMTSWQVTSQIHSGLDDLYQGARGLHLKPAAIGLTKLATAVTSPFTYTYGGGKVMQFFKNQEQFLSSFNGRMMLKHYPNLPELVRLVFVGGFRPGLNDDFALGTSSTNPGRELAAGRLVGAAKSAIPWLTRGVAIPLFQYIVPRMKLMNNVQMLAAKLDQYSEAIADGSITEETIARNVVALNEASFGEFNYQNNFWDNTVKTSIQLLTGFPGWKEGTWLTPMRAVREVASQNYADKYFEKIQEEGDRLDWARKYTKRLPQLGLNTGRLLAAAIFATGVAAMIGKGVTGEWLWDTIQEDHVKYGLNYVQSADLEILHPRLKAQADPITGKPLRFNLPMDLRDYEHAAMAPGSYIYHSLAPYLQSSINTMRNRNAFDNYVYNPAEPYGKGYKAFEQGIFYNLQETFEPITVSNALQEGGPQDAKGHVAKVLGLTGGAPPTWDMTRTEARVKGLIQAKHIPLTPEQEYAYEHDTRSSITTAARNGDNEYLERAFKRLSYTEAKELVESPQTTPAERQFLKPHLEKKRIDSIYAARRRSR